MRGRRPICSTRRGGHCCRSSWFRSRPARRRCQVGACPTATTTTSPTNRRGTGRSRGVTARPSMVWSRCSITMRFSSALTGCGLSGRARRGCNAMRRSMLALLTVASLAPAAGGDAATLRTDTSKALVPLDEVVSGGPSPDGIPAIDRPAFVGPGGAAAWMAPKEPVLALEIKGDARAYPLQILMWHEIVNDVVGGVPVTVTFCPLCNSGIVFQRVVDETTLDFGTSGKLYKSDLVMYDRQSHSLWAQMEGRAIVGTYAGTRLKLIPANTISFEEWRATHPGGKVLSRGTGHGRSYGVNPYQSYDQPQLGPFLFRGELDPRRPSKERVDGLTPGEVARSYPCPVRPP